MKLPLLPFTAAVFGLAYLLPTVNAAAADEAPVKGVEIFQRDHPEQADKVIIVKRIEFKPGAADLPHAHAGMVTGYVVEGTFEFQVKGEPLLKLKAGDTFFEPPGSHHIVARNPDASANTVIVAFIVNPKGAPVSTPLK